MKLRIKIWLIDMVRILMILKENLIKMFLLKLIKSFKNLKKTNKRGSMGVIIIKTKEIKMLK